MKRSLLVYMILAAAASLLRAQPAGIQPDPATPLPPDTAVIEGVLPNGLRYYVRANHKPEKRAELLLVVKAGSVLEENNERGLSHFLEHMAFEGTKNFPKQTLVDYMESIGMRFGANLNAGTGYDQTIYNLTVPTDSMAQLIKAFLILEDWAHQISFEDAEIDKERGVILEEWRQGRGARARIWDKQSPVLFAGSRYAGRNPIGDTGAIRRFPYKRIKDYYKRWYRPNLMAVIAVGDFDRDSVVQQIKIRFAEITNPKKPKPRPFFPVPVHPDPRFSIVTDPEATETSISVLFLRKPDTVNTIGSVRREVEYLLFNTMLNQRLSELARLPQAPFIAGYAYKGGFVDAVDAYALGANVPDTGAAAGLAALLTEARRVRLYGFAATELARAKAELLRQAEKEYQERDKTESSAFEWQYVSNYLHGNSYLSAETDYRLTRTLLPGIELDQINALTAKLITDENRVFLASGPQKTDLRLPGEKELRQEIARVEEQAVDPYVDKVATQDLMSKKPKPGKVVRQKEYKDLGLTEWKLSNGVRALLKPTDFKNDEIIMRSFSLGGTSLADSAILPSAIFADEIIDEGGLAEFDQIQLEKFLAGKIAIVNPGIGWYDQSITASTAP
ncbi:MAG: pitrilysin family protein, partial [Candidatus Edwardsbacteria bacterium]|nr:pitrilysin family protein [Candidatus Edwardsbacteria bacterium]